MSSLVYLEELPQRRVYAGRSHGPHRYCKLSDMFMIPKAEIDFSLPTSKFLD